MAKITKEQYEFALARIEELLPVVDDNTPANDRNAVELTMMSDVVIDYEKEHYPIGKPTVAQLIQLSLDEKNMSQKQLATYIPLIRIHSRRNFVCAFITFADCFWIIISNQVGRTVIDFYVYYVFLYFALVARAFTFILEYQFYTFICFIGCGECVNSLTIHVVVKASCFATLSFPT